MVLITINPVLLATPLIKATPRLLTQIPNFFHANCCRQNPYLKPHLDFDFG